MRVENCTSNTTNLSSPNRLGVVAALATTLFSSGAGIFARGAEFGSNRLGGLIAPLTLAVRQGEPPFEIAPGALGAGTVGAAVAERLDQRFNALFNTFAEQREEGDAWTELRTLRETVLKELQEREAKLLATQEALNRAIADFNQDAKSFEAKLARAQELKRAYEQQFNRRGAAESAFAKADAAAERVVGLMNPLATLSQQADQIAQELNGIIEAVENGTDPHTAEAAQLENEFNQWAQNVQGEVEGEIAAFNADVEDFNAWWDREANALENQLNHVNNSIEHYNSQVETVESLHESYEIRVIQYNEYIDFCNESPDFCSETQIDIYEQDIANLEGLINSSIQVLEQRRAAYELEQQDYNAMERRALSEHASEEAQITRAQQQLERYIKEQERAIENERREVEAHIEQLQSSIEERVTTLDNRYKEVESQIREQYGPHFEALYEHVAASLEKGPEQILGGGDNHAVKIDRLEQIGTLGSQIVAALHERAVHTHTGKQIATAISVAENAYSAAANEVNKLGAALDAGSAQIEKQRTAIEQGFEALNRDAEKRNAELQTKEDELIRELQNEDRILAEAAQIRGDVLLHETEYYRGIFSGDASTELQDRIVNKLAEVQEKLVTVMGEDTDPVLYSARTFLEVAAEHREEATPFGEWVVPFGDYTLTELGADESATVRAQWYNLLVANDYFRDVIEEVTELVEDGALAERGAAGLWTAGVRGSTVLSKAQGVDGETGIQVVLDGESYWLSERGELLAVNNDTGRLFEYRFTTPESTPEGRELRELYRTLQSQFQGSLGTLPEFRQGAVALAEALLRAADEAHDQARKQELMSYARTAIELAVGLSPLGDVSDAVAAVTGRSVTGTVLAPEERVYALLGLIAGNSTVWRELADSLLPKMRRLIDSTPGVSSDLQVTLRHLPIEEAQRLQNIAAKYARTGGTQGTRFVKQLPDLTGSQAAAFSGPILKGEYKPGEVIFQVQRQGQSGPGRWFGPTKPVNPKDADERYNVVYWNNPGDVVKAFVVKERVSGYAGKVADGGGHQFFISEDVIGKDGYAATLSEVLEEVPLTFSR